MCCETDAWKCKECKQKMEGADSCANVESFDSHLIVCEGRIIDWDVPRAEISKVIADKLNSQELLPEDVDYIEVFQAVSYYPMVVRQYAVIEIP